MQVLCQFPDCKKAIEAKKDMKYCPYCGTSFSLYGLNIDEIVEAEKAREKKGLTNGDIFVLRFLAIFIITSSLFFLYSTFKYMNLGPPSSLWLLSSIAFISATIMATIFFLSSFRKRK